MTAEEILAIPANAPERLYPGDMALARHKHRQLSSEWHPDKHPEKGSAVLAHINALYETAVARMQDGKWAGPSVVQFTAKTGRTYRMHYLRAHAFELGMQYIGYEGVLYRIDGAYADLVANSSRIVHALSFADDAMRKEHERYLPGEDWTPYATADDRVLYVRVKKAAGMILLRDLVQHMGKLPAVHVAWITSSLLALSCYLDWAAVVHGDINEGTLFVDPAQHAVSLLGGWWYAARAGVKLVAAPSTTLNELPQLRSRPFAMRSTDGELIRALARRLLGGPKGVPDALWRWALGAAQMRAYGEYHEWQHHVLPAAFGVRRFVKLEVTAAMVYGAGE